MPKTQIFQTNGYYLRFHIFFNFEIKLVFLISILKKNKPGNKRNGERLSYLSTVAKQ